MAQSIRITVGFVVVALGLIGCSEILGSSDFRDVSVRVGTESVGDSIAVSVSVDNQSADEIFYHTECGGGLQRRDEDGWQRALDYACVGWPPPPAAIPSQGDYAFDYKIETDHPWFPPGDYRYVLALFDGEDDAELLPDGVRTSNTFRIE